MALVLKTKTTRNQAGTELYIEFLQATGVYAVTTNEGGFGTPNPDRNDLAILFWAEHKGTAEDVLVQAVAHDPSTVSSFTVALTRAINGHLNIWLFAVPIFDVGDTYENGDVVWDNTNPEAAIIKKRVGGVWETILIDDLFDEAEVVNKEINLFPVPEAEAFRNSLNADRIKALEDKVNEKCPEEEYESARTSFDFVDGMLEAAVNDFCAGAYAEAQKKIDKIFEYETVLDEQN